MISQAYQNHLTKHITDDPSMGLKPNTNKKNVAIILFASTLLIFLSYLRSTLPKYHKLKSRHINSTKKRESPFKMDLWTWEWALGINRWPAEPVIKVSKTVLVTLDMPKSTFQSITLDTLSTWSSSSRWSANSVLMFFSNPKSSKNTESRC